jgi:peptidoglycan-associated lipoprotein
MKRILGYSNRVLAITLTLAAAAMLAGCHSKPTAADQAGGSQVPSSATTGGDSGPSTSMSPLGGDAGANGAAGNNGPLSGRVIYFDFDKSEIKPEFAPLITTYAHNLTAHPSLKVKLEGNTDERGTREYNIGLGERRAQAVRRALLLQGVAESQVTTVSFGAERPAAEGDDESAWSLNRRVELVYLPQ